MLFGTIRDFGTFANEFSKDSSPRPEGSCRKVGTNWVRLGTGDQMSPGPLFLGDVDAQGVPPIPEKPEKGCITTCIIAHQRWPALTSAESAKSPCFQRSRAPDSYLISRRSVVRFYPGPLMEIEAPLGLR